jgi:hypothetical protein
MGQPSLRVPWVSWGALIVVSASLALSSLWVALTPAGDQTELTGRTWDQFAQQDLEVASLYSMDLAILGTLGAGLGVLAVVVSSIPYRRGEHWAWYALWLVAITIGAVATRMLVERYPAGYYFAGITAVALVALLMPIRNLRRPHE